jgi:3-hydroxybutyryl-CoA dehydratase
MQVTNTHYEAITLGQTARYSKTLTERDVLLFAEVSGDFNPVHLDADYAASTVFGERIGHGMWTGAVVSAAIAKALPGPGSVYVSQTLKFTRPVKINDTLTVELAVTAKQDRRRMVTLDCVATNQHGEKVATGEAVVIAPALPLTVEFPD